ncbi:hypothetical protein CA13_40640 [Planctomycetes bacterium CA13]|uniref:Putative glutamine amidotransferase domain-containing protein n=1 Tax=Novipirellula herctigrandis TaxID=2527986 RepID=A0A5C5Z718_9BACT|nr:hypothetical protein CA13_40640 [Planctomycetes bacterium CA13]
MNSFHIEPIYDSSLVALAASVVIVAVLILVTPPTEDPQKRRWLMLLRAIAGLVLVVAMFRPGVVRTDTRAAEATLVVAIDVSRSMTLPDDEKSDRWTHQKQAWQSLAEGLEPLADSMNVRLLSYGKTTAELPNPTPATLDIVVPDGELTDLAAAATGAIAIAQGQPLAGVVMMGDGTQTAPIQGNGAERVAQTLKAWGVPLWSVPIGPASGPSANRDAAIDALPESYQLFAGNQFEVSFQVPLRGLAGISVPVQITWIDENGKATLAAQRRVLSETANSVGDVSIPLIAPAPGTYRLNVEVETQAGELVTTNNLQTAFVNVREGGGRILYIEGESLYEQRFLRMALRRFPDLDLTYQWIPRDTASRWPVDLGDWFEKGRFDIYIIGDVDADAIGREQLAELAETVGAGAGLITLGGYHTYGAGGYASSPLADVISIRMDPSRRRDINSEIQPNTPDQIAGPISVQPARRHPVTDLGGADPVRVWKTLPRLLGANRFVGPKVAPGVQVLLETTDGAPLLVVGEFGRGRTVASAFDSTWQWWREGKSEAHRRFWRQVVLWLLSREEDSTEQINLELDARRFAVDADVGFRATLTSIAENQSIDFVAEILDESNTITPVTDLADTSEGNSQTVTGKIPKLIPGYYRLRVGPRDTASKLNSENLAFQVVDQSREMTMPMADPVYLRQLADITAEHGGGSFSYEQIDDLIERIAKRRKQAEAPVVEKFTLGDDPLTGWILFALFATALIIEWTLRRRWGFA